MQVYRKKWVIHIERITREKVNGVDKDSTLSHYCCTSCCACIAHPCCACVAHPAPRRAHSSLSYDSLRSLMRPQPVSMSCPSR